MLTNFSRDPESPALVIGAASIDVVGRLQRDLEAGTSNPAHIRTSFGGIARNVAENLARLGQPVTLLTAVGEDQVGDQLLWDTANAGVNIDHVLRIPEHPTGSYLATISSVGELAYALDDMRAVASLTPEYLRQQRKLFGEASALFMDANLPPETIATAISFAKEAKLAVCVDPTSTALASKFQPHLSDILLLTPNSNEAAILCQQPVDKSDREGGLGAAKHLVTQGVDFAIVTLAEFGVSYATSETSGHIRAIKTEIVDPTGGGDALCAAVIFALLNEISPDEAVRLGIAAASLTLRYSGTVVPDLSLEKLYDQI